VSPWLALLIYPFAPGIAARRLQGAWAGAVVPLVVTASAAVYLAEHGATTGDALAAAASLLRLLAGLSIGGACAAWIGARLAGREASARELAGPVLAAAGWAPCVFLAFLALAMAAGAGAATGVYAGIALLIWGVSAGIGIVAGEEECEPGRLLVASCLGLGGVLIGLWIALAAPPAPGVQAIRAPVPEAGIRAGDFLLVRAGNAPSDGALVLLRDPRSREAVLARRDRNGTLTPVGEIQVGPEKLQDWNIAGRVFFRFGTEGGGIVGPGEQSPKPSRD